MFDRLKKEQRVRQVEPLPGWFAQRKRELPAATDILAMLPSGAVIPESFDSEPMMAVRSRRG
jgi:hypothetical protein